MTRIVIDPVTRIEGHAKISIFLDEAGAVRDAHFHVTEFRAFETFCIGRPVWEMPGITARICGICPVSHLLASAKAGDAILAVDVPPAALTLRRLMNLGQIVQSHALSFFHLTAPDLLLGFDSDPAQRNIFGLIAAEPELARNGIRLRQFGQTVIERLGGRKIHPSWATPGGVRAGIDRTERDLVRAELPELFAIVRDALERFTAMLDQYRDEAAVFGVFPSRFLALVGPDGAWEHHDGVLRMVDHDGAVLVDRLDPAQYRTIIAEAVEPWSYMKFAYYRAAGYPAGIYRVGPLARLNVCTQIGTPLADAELRAFRERGGGTVNASFFAHYARLIEILAALELIALLLDDPTLDDRRLRAEAGINRLHGVGVSEAPRGTLFHDYTVDEHGLMQRVNLVIATGQNNLALNRTVTQIAQQYVHGPQIPEGMLNRVEAGVRAYDPCLSCATHAVGAMPLHIELIDADGKQIDEVQR